MVSEIWDLRRHRDDVRIAGVCGGLARLWRVDPLLVRVAAVVCSLSMGVGLIAYARLWFAVARDGETTSLAVRRFPSVAHWSRGGVGVIGLLVILAWLTTVGAVFPLDLGPVVVLGIVVLIGNHYRRLARQQVAPTTPQVPSPDFLAAANAWQARVYEATGVPLTPAAAATFETGVAAPRVAQPAPVGAAPSPQTWTAPPLADAEHAPSTTMPAAETDSDSPRTLAVSNPTTPSGAHERRPWFGAVVTIVAMLAVALGWAFTITVRVSEMARIPWLVPVSATAIVFGSATLLASFAKRAKVLITASVLAAVVTMGAVLAPITPRQTVQLGHDAVRVTPDMSYVGRHVVVDLTAGADDLPPRVSLKVVGGNVKVLLNAPLKNVTVRATSVGGAVRVPEVPARYGITSTTYSHEYVSGVSPIDLQVVVVAGSVTIQEVP